MKKLFVLLLALMMVGGIAFAQATVGIYSKMYATLEEDTVSYDNYTNLSFAWKADDMGMSITTETATTSDFLSGVRNFDVWYSLVPGKVKLWTGDLRQDGGVRLTSFIEGNGFSTRIANANRLSLMLAVTPIDGLVIDAVVPFATDAFVTVNPSTNLAFGAGYTITDVAKIVASYRMTEEELAIGVDLKMVEGLTAKVGFKNVGSTDISTIYATAGYTLDALTFGLDAYFQLDPSLYAFEGKVEYAMDPFSFGVLASFDNEGATGWFKQDGFSLYPYVMMGFSKGDIELGFRLNADNTWSIPFTFYVSM